MLLQGSCTWLTLMPLLLSLSIGELSFYRDALPETPEDIAIKQLARYLEAHHLQHLQQRFHRSYLPTFLSPMQLKEHNTLQQTHQKIIWASQALPKTFWESLMKTKPKEKVLTRYHRPNQYYDPIVNKIAEREYLPYYYVDVDGIRHREEEQSNEDADRFSKDIGYKPPFEMDGSIADEPVEDSYYAKYDDYNHAIGTFGHHESGREAAMKPANEPDFTYKLDNSNPKEKHPFGVKPNDRRYYDDPPFSSDRQDAPRADWKEEKTANEERTIRHEGEHTWNPNQKLSKDSTLDASRPERPSAIEAGLHPLILPVHRDINNDVYFIAIVAGCSAAAMFALVLVTLTWCRLQRGAKAAADIEYPAYGVTGPNKDVSPSGDQRLAQSAQMYHFQHQKQQIIAMENRTSATRDPGSLSEAESDEENEEGDYTVYECPGLASTGEMEVKNPMFHDDPTPATPAMQGNNKEEDHIVSIK